MPDLNEALCCQRLKDRTVCAWSDSRLQGYIGYIVRFVCCFIAPAWLDEMLLRPAEWPVRGVRAGVSFRLWLRQT
jgi:hypothetical protein